VAKASLDGGRGGEKGMERVHKAGDIARSTRRQIIDTDFLDECKGGCRSGEDETVGGGSGECMSVVGWSCVAWTTRHEVLDRVTADTGHEKNVLTD
jgi:hypothetical protein